MKKETNPACTRNQLHTHPRLLCRMKRTFNSNHVAGPQLCHGHASDPRAEPMIWSLGCLAPWGQALALRHNSLSIDLFCCLPQQEELFVWFLSRSKYLNAKQEQTSIRACQKQSIFPAFRLQLYRFPLQYFVPVNLGWVHESSLTVPVGKCDTSLWKGMWQLALLLLREGLAWLG